MSSVEKLIVNLDTVYDMLTSVQKLEKVTELEEEHSGTLRLVKHEPLHLKIQDLNYTEGKSINLEVKQSQKVAISFQEPNDATHIINCICGFIDLKDNWVFWNGLTIKNYNLDNLRQHLIVYDGEVKWLDLPMHDNIDLNISKRDDISLEILEVSGLKEHIDDFEHGLDTVVYSSSLRDYSQFAYRLQLARVLSSNVQFLILYEPFAFTNEQNNRKLADYLLNIKHKSILVFTNYTYFIEKSDLTQKI